MKRLVVFLLFGVYTVAIMQLRAESPIVQMMEGEIRAGLTTPLDNYHTGKAQVSGTLGIEGRYIFNHLQ
ncbi:MAG: hypothetical protein K2L45_06985 [Muribaculaceae bacterium]|nr:hypothetical protein [Muribaculaceae bacterium]